MIEIAQHIEKVKRNLKEIFESSQLFSLFQKSPEYLGENYRNMNKMMKTAKLIEKVEGNPQEILESL